VANHRERPVSQDTALRISCRIGAALEVGARDLITAAESVICARGGRDGPSGWGVITATRRRLPGQARPRRPVGLWTPGTADHAWLARGAAGMRRRQVLRQRAGQRVKQEMAAAEVGCGGPDAPAGDELQGGGRCGPAVDVQSHAQERAQRSAGQADLGPACTRVVVVADRPAQSAFADVQFAVLRCALPTVKCGPRRFRTGCPRSAGMPAMPAPGTCPRSCLPHRR
jgi:hypothetical protein